MIPQQSNSKLRAGILHPAFLCIPLLCLISGLRPAAGAGDEQPAASRPPLSVRIDAVIAESCDGPEVPLASDSEFLRRVFLDLTGRSPNLDETRAFFRRIETGEQTSAAARVDLIDDLLAREEFSRHYANVLEVMFTERRELISYRELRNFIRQWLEDRRPLNELCLELLAADGTGEQMRAAAGFILNRNAEPHLVTRDIGRIFFGRDIQCAQCHDHPLVSDYEQSEYFGILSFVHRTYLFQDEKRGKAPFLGEKAEGALDFASVFNPESTRRPAQLVLPMAMALDTEPQFVDDQDTYIVAPDKEHRGVPRYSRRQQLAVLATHRENLSFNRNIANRLWAQMLGMGVVHPVDMHHSDNPPASAALLRLLSESLVEGGYDLREFLRQIARSHAYQRSSVPPAPESWAGPDGGDAVIAARLTATQEQLSRLTPQMEQLTADMQAAALRVQHSMQDVETLRKQVDEARTALRKLTEAHTQETGKLTEIQTRKAKQTELIASLTNALSEADRISKLMPDDQELVQSRSLFESRLKTANEALPAIEEQLSDQQEVTEDSKIRVDDQRSRIHALTNRCLALGEFVVEARGVQRRTRVEMQRVIDQKTDLEQMQQRDTLLREFLTSRTPDKQARLLSEWQRCFVLRQVRSLSPEQLASATYTALGLDRAVRTRAMAEWEKNHQDNPAARDDGRSRELFVNTALAVDGPWEVLEDLIVERYAAPAGAPQDGFFATVDQALTLQNSAEYLNLLKPNSGNLAERLISVESPELLAEELYLSILCRRPDTEELQMVVSLLNRQPEEKSSIVQELLWGLLTSSEFRFMF
ncbi:MAG: Chromosome partition protein Smc [Planctomycetota bacterium]